MLTDVCEHQEDHHLSLSNAKVKITTACYCWPDMRASSLCSDLSRYHVPVFFYKVPGGHDSEAGGVIWEMTDRRAGGQEEVRLVDTPGSVQQPQAHETGSPVGKVKEARMCCVTMQH